MPAYSWRGFFDHQLRWLRTVRDARPAGYAGLIFTHGLGWALLNVLASGLSPLSLWLLALSFFLRLAQAMTVGAAVLGDHQVIAESVAAAAARRRRHGAMGGGLRRKHHRLARRAVRARRTGSWPKQFGETIRPLIAARHLPASSSARIASVSKLRHSPSSSKSFSQRGRSSASSAVSASPRCAESRTRYSAPATDSGRMAVR